jgi:hypothetical protein
MMADFMGGTVNKPVNSRMGEWKVRRERVIQPRLSVVTNIGGSLHAVWIVIKTQRSAYTDTQEILRQDTREFREEAVQGLSIARGEAVTIQDREIKITLPYRLGPGEGWGKKE